MKAVILCAGIGSRLRPHTDDKPKILVNIGQETIGQMMIGNLVSVGITEIVVVTGYHCEKVEKTLVEWFPNVNFTFIRNNLYEETNTAYSLSLVEQVVRGHDFIKLDGDVVFELNLLKKLVESEYQNCLCFDRDIQLAKEEVKVVLDDQNIVLKVGKSIDPSSSNGESIGIEKLSKDAAPLFFAELKSLLADPKNAQAYYDDSYPTLIKNGVPFYGLDISGLKWVEIDTHEDYAKAQEYFGNASEVDRLKE